MIPANNSANGPSPQQVQQLVRKLDQAQDALQQFFDMARGIPSMGGPRPHPAYMIVRNAVTELVRAEMELKGEQ